MIDSRPEKLQPAMDPLEVDDEVEENFDHTQDAWREWVINKIKRDPEFCEMLRKELECMPEEFRSGEY